MRHLAAWPDAYRDAAQLGGLKKVLRKAAGPILAAGAIATGQPQLVVPALSVGSSLKKKKKGQVEPPVEPIPAGGWFSTLPPGDRNALMIGGAVVGTLLLSKLLTGGRR